MDKLPFGLWVVVIAAYLLTLLVVGLQDNPLRQMRYHIDLQARKDLLWLGLPVLLLYGVAKLFGFETAAGFPFFAGGFLLPWLLFQVNLAGVLRGIVVLAASIGMTLLIPAGDLLLMAIFHTIAGLLFWTLFAALFYQAKAPWEDTLPAMLWLVGLLWTQITLSDGQRSVYQGMLLAALAIAAVCQVLQRIASPFHGKLAMLKPVLIALLGGLALWVALYNVLLMPHMFAWALLFGGGLLVAPLLHGIEEGLTDWTWSQKSILALVVIGFATLLASRLFGSFAWLVLAVSMLVSLRPGFTVFASAFWMGRTLLQAFVLQYNPNITGINLLHPYVSAALYGGFILMLLMPFLWQETEKQPAPILLLLGIGTLAPMATNLFLHAEPTGSFLIAALVAALGISILGPLFFRSQEASPILDHLLWIPAYMTAMGLISHELIPLGNEATRGTKLAILFVGVVGLAVFWVVLQRLWLRRYPVKVSGN